jgi:hypothetical protein
MRRLSEDEEVILQEMKIHFLKLYPKGIEAGGGRKTGFVVQSETQYFTIDISVMDTQ